MDKRAKELKVALENKNMDKDYIEVKIPILDSVDEMKVVKTFTQEQLWFVCAIAKAFEKSEQQVKKQKEVIDKATNELFILKDMIYKPETREENFEIQRKISSIIKRLNGKEVSE